MPSGNRRNPSRTQRLTQRVSRNEDHNSEFLQVIQLQLEAVTARQASLRQQQRSSRRSRSRSPTNPPSRSPSLNLRSWTTSPVRNTHNRTRSPLLPSNRHRHRPRTSPPPPPIRLDLDPRQEAGRTARPSLEEESVIGWAEYAGSRERSNPPHNPFAADSFRPSYEHNYTERTNHSEPNNCHSTHSTSHARGRGYRGARRGGRGRGNNRGRGSERSLFDRINL
jgi:hypothetical protein